MYGNINNLIDSQRPADRIVFITDPGDFSKTASPAKGVAFEIRNDGYAYTVRYESFFPRKSEIIDERQLTDDEFKEVKEIYNKHIEKHGRIYDDNE